MTTENGKPVVRSGKPTGKKGADGLALALATGLSVPQAAKKAGIGVNTAYVRLRDPAFRDDVVRARDELLSRAVNKLVCASCDAVDALTANLSDASPAVRNKAAATILASMIQGVGLTEILKRLEALEENRP